jgi:hypothetical protein
MFALEQIDELHARLGSSKTLPEYAAQGQMNRVAVDFGWK